MEGLIVPTQEPNSAFASVDMDFRHCRPHVPTGHGDLHHRREQRDPRDHPHAHFNFFALALG